jgi:hypothetical protein
MDRDQDTWEVQRHPRRRSHRPWTLNWVWNCVVVNSPATGLKFLQNHLLDWKYQRGSNRLIGIQGVSCCYWGTPLCSRAGGIIVFMLIGLPAIASRNLSFVRQSQRHVWRTSIDILVIAASLMMHCDENTPVRWLFLVPDGCFWCHQQQ